MVTVNVSLGSHIIYEFINKESLTKQKKKEKEQKSNHKKQVLTVRDDGK